MENVVVYLVQTLIISVCFYAFVVACHVVMVPSYSPETANKKLLMWFWLGMCFITLILMQLYVPRFGALPWSDPAGAWVNIDGLITFLWAGITAIYPIRVLKKAEPDITVQETWNRIWRWGEESEVEKPSLVYLKSVAGDDKTITMYVEALPESKPSGKSIFDAIDKRMPEQNSVTKDVTSLIGYWFKDDNIAFTLDEVAGLVKEQPSSLQKEFLRNLAISWSPPVRKENGTIDWPGSIAESIYKYIYPYLKREPLLVVLEGGQVGQLLGDYLPEVKAQSSAPTWVMDTFGDQLRNRTAVRVEIPEKLRFEHHFILGGSGHGKSHLIKSMILRDLESENKSLIVIDSQRALIRDLLPFVPEDRIVHIDPTDPDYWLAINIFDAGNAELMEYVFAGLDANMTSKQAMVYHFMSVLMQSIPGATLHTMRDALEEGGLNQFQGDIDRLGDTEQSFFRAFQSTREYTETRQQIQRRLFTLLSDKTMAGMLSAPETKINLVDEINQGKVILIDTAKGHLGKNFQLFGRFWIAQIRKAMYSEKLNKPTMLYIDEAQEYFSDEEMITELFIQARKYQIGLIIATQFFGQLPQKLRDGVLANTSIKFAGGVSAKDASPLAKEMRTDADTLLSAHQGNFYAYLKGYGGRWWREAPIPEQEVDRDRSRWIRDKMRERYYMPKSTIEVGANQPSPEFDKNQVEKGEPNKQTRYSNLDFIDEDD